MPVVYVRLEVGIHGLCLRSEAELEELRVAVCAAVKAAHPSLRYENDVDVDVCECAGNLAAAPSG